MVIYFIKYQANSYEELHWHYLQQNCGESGAVFLWRNDGFQSNKSKIHLLQEQEQKTGEEVTIYTDDETMLAYAQYDESIHNYKVFIEDEDTDEFFIPLYERRPNIRIVNNLVSMCHKGLLDKKEDFE